MKLSTNLLSILLLTATITHAGTHVHKHVLDNGLTILVRPVKTTQKVSTQLWFDVGSKHESDDEKGLAHWLEHMCFKGTERMSETDIRLTAAKLSGVWNATTSYDWTRFYLNFPTQHWFEALPILADIMNNCTFKQDLLNAEVQVVIQEMKNNRDNFIRQLAMRMISSIFPDHPYHYPVIGYKSDLEQLSAQKLRAFYKKHYVPNNAVLVVVGNVDPDEVIKRAEKEFGSIKPDWSHAHKSFTSQEDICAKNVVLYRDVQKPHLLVAFRIPGSKQLNSILVDVLQSLLSGGAGSRLHKKLVDKEQLVSGISIFSWDLVDSDMLILSCVPHEAASIEKILEIITQELADLATNGPEIHEVEWAVQKIESGFYDFMETNHQQAHSIAQTYLATHNEDLLFEYIHHDYEKIKHEIQDFAGHHLRHAVMHTGILLPLPEQEKSTWHRLQMQSNAQDAQLLADKMRVSDVEPGKYVHTVWPQEPDLGNVPQPQTIALSNGLKVLYYHNDNVPKIKARLQLKFDSWYEPHELPGLCAILNSMLLEGTIRLAKDELIGQLDQHGIGLSIGNGVFSISMLQKHCTKGFELLTDILCNPAFENENLNKIKQQALSRYIRFWDNADSILNHTINKHIWADQVPNTIGTPESISAITPHDLKAFHKKYYSPCGATLSLVGDLSGINLSELLESTLGTWQGPEVQELEIKTPQPEGGKEITYPLEREQIVLAVAGLSVDRYDPDFYALLLFDQVFNKKLFNLREQTSAFYSIGGSVLGGADKRPGISYIATQVSQTRAQEAQELIMAIIEHIAQSFTEYDLVEAQNHLINSLSDRYSTNSSIAKTFLFLDEYALPYNYLVTRNRSIKKITVQDVQNAVKRVLNKHNMSVFKVGAA